MEITGSIGRRADLLSVRFAILCDLSKIAVAAPSTHPERKARLWEETCLEIFLGEQVSGRYWEFHLSPSGDWNVYRFASYREGMREEPAFPSLPFFARTEPGTLRLSLDLDIGKIVPPASPLEAAACAVVKTVQGQTSHWALFHPGPRPDFHRREGFRIAIPGLIPP
jgi:hypothetical protein